MDALTQLSRPHPREGKTEPALLAVLESSVASDTSSRSGGSGGGAALPIDPGALDLLTAISSGIPVKGGGGVVPRLLQWAAADLIPARAAAVGWLEQIRNLLEPKPVVPLRGEKCLACGRASMKDQVTREIKPVLLAVPATGDPYVECRACGTRWSGSDLKKFKKVVGYDASRTGEVSV